MQQLIFSNIRHLDISLNYAIISKFVENQIKEQYTKSDMSLPSLFISLKVTLFWKNGASIKGSR
jgi:hypothetical protein